MPSEGIISLQQGLLDYVEKRAAFSPCYADYYGDSYNLVKAQRDYVEAMYEHFLNYDYIGERVASIFSVEDTYSQDTTLHYDGKAKKWKI